MNYVHQNGRLFHQYELPDPLSEKVTFIATDIRKEKTGIHAQVEIYLDRTLEAYSVFNIGRDEDRTRLVNSAYKTFGSTVQAYYEKDALKHNFDMFCHGLYSASLGELKAEELNGEPNRKISFIAQPHIIEGGGTILFAPGGSTKSYTALLMAISIDSGCDMFWPVEYPRKCMYINLERDRGGIGMRIGRINRILELDERRPLTVFNARGKPLDGIRDAIEEEIKRLEVEVIFLDSISRTGHGDMTRDVTANKTADTLSDLCPTWLAIAHAPRQDSTHVFGSVHYENAADVMLRLVSEQKDEDCIGVGLDINKANDIRKGQMKILKYQWDADGLASCALSSADEFPGLLLERELSFKQKVMQFLEYDAGEATASQIANRLGLDRSKVSRLLSNDEDFIRRRRSGKEVYYGVRGPDEPPM